MGNRRLTGIMRYDVKVDIPDGCRTAKHMRRKEYMDITEVERESRNIRQMHIGDLTGTSIQHAINTVEM